jgi:hypothetical protein
MKSSATLGRLAWAVFAAIHFGLSHLILPLTMALVQQASGAAEGAGMAVTLLVRLTRLLHFPIVTLALYPREWFPGNWIYLPMAANSLIWGFGICWLVGLFRKAR